MSVYFVEQWYHAPAIGESLRTPIGILCVIACNRNLSFNTPKGSRQTVGKQLLAANDDPNKSFDVEVDWIRVSPAPSHVCVTILSEVTKYAWLGTICDCHLLRNIHTCNISARDVHPTMLHEPCLVCVLSSCSCVGAARRGRV